MVLTSFYIEDKSDWAECFEETFLLTNINIEMAL